METEAMTTSPLKFSSLLSYFYHCWYSQHLTVNCFCWNDCFSAGHVYGPSKVVQFYQISVWCCNKWINIEIAFKRYHVCAIPVSLLCHFEVLWNLYLCFSSTMKYVYWRVTQSMLPLQITYLKWSTVRRQRRNSASSGATGPSSLHIMAVAWRISTRFFILVFKVIWIRSVKHVPIFHLISSFNKFCRWNIYTDRYLMQTFLESEFETEILSNVSLLCWLFVVFFLFIGCQVLKCDLLLHHINYACGLLTRVIREQLL